MFLRQPGFTRYFSRRLLLSGPDWVVRYGGETSTLELLKTFNWIPPWAVANLASKSYGSLQSTVCYESDLRVGNKLGEVEKLWRDLFSDPSKWRDHRFHKGTPRFPDFKHKKTEKSLWLNSESTPPWVQAKLDAIRPGTIESSNFSWNQRLARYTQNGQYQRTMELFHQMQRDGIPADRFTFVPVLKACASLGLLEHGRRIHSESAKPGFETDLILGSSLVDMYAKCGSIEDAWTVFHQMPKRDVVTWNAMILGYVKGGEGHRALELFEQMQREEVVPSRVTFLGVLNACASVAALEEGRRAHEEIIRRGYFSSVFVKTCLVDMYAKCGSIEEAERVFNQMLTRDVAAWNAMIVGYVKCGEGRKALGLFERMQQDGVATDRVTFIGVLNACSNIAALEVGRRAHEEIIQRGYESDVPFRTCLVDMYAKCGSIKEAERVFNQMTTRDVVAWTAMIVGYVNCGEGQKALELFEQMKEEGVAPDRVTFVGILSACASVAALELGRRTHEDIVQGGYESDLSLGNSLIDMYAKCGSIEEAERVFHKMPTRDLVGWTAMMEGYGSHGYAKEALETFKKMCEVVQVDSVTFIPLLSACSHAGLVEEGLQSFKSMSAVYNITPTLDHYACVVDLLGRAGRLREAEELIMSMPLKPNAAIWMSLLSSCRVHGNMQMGELVAKRVLELDPKNVAASVLLSNIYAFDGKVDSVADVTTGGLPTSL